MRIEISVKTSDEFWVDERGWVSEGVLDESIVLATCRCKKWK